MFTGLIEQIGQILACEPTEKGLKLTIQSTYSDLHIGESIAVDGACLTVTAIDGSRFNCDVSQETMRVTVIGSYREKRLVNLERSLKVGDRIGGHFVLGHVDCVAVIANRTVVGECIEYHVELPRTELMRYIIIKGSICVNGVSLTVNEVFGTGFRVMIIPHTSVHTTFSTLDVGDNINIEFDYLVKAVQAKPISEVSHV